MKGPKIAPRPHGSECGLLILLKLWTLNLPRKRRHLHSSDHPLKARDFLHNLITLPSPLYPHALSVPQVSVSLPHRTMDQTDSYHAGVAATPYVFGGLGEHYPQTSHVDLASALEHLSNLPIFDAVNDTAFDLAPTSMGTHTNSTTPPEYAFPVSNQRLHHGY